MEEEKINELNPQEDPTLNEGGESSGADGADTGDKTPPTKETDDTTARIQALETELENTKKRYSGSTKSWQQERADRERIQSELDRYKRYEKVVDLSQFDDLLDEGTPSTQQQSSSQPDQKTIQRLSQLEIKVLESDYALKNPDKAFVLKDPFLKGIAEVESAKLMQQENLENGRIISQPEEIIGKGVDAAIKHYNRIKEEGAKSVTEKREKIKETATDVAGNNAKRETKKGDEDETYSSRDNYVASRDKHQHRIQYGQDE